MTSSKSIVDQLCQQFRNNFIIVVGPNQNFEDFVKWQLSFPYESTLFLTAKTNAECVTLIEEIYTSMNDKERFNHQVAYFKRMEADLITPETARKILNEIFELMGLTPEDTLPLLRRYPSFASIIQNIHRIDEIPDLHEVAKYNLKKLFTTSVENLQEDSEV
jgi:hypothetical protein